MGTWPSQYEQIDLLEIYHARSVRDHLLRDLRRLSETEALPTMIDDTRRRQVRDYYESMLIASAELLYLLGDRAS